MNNLNIEILDGTTYVSTENARGNIITVWSFFGTTFVQTNKSAPRALQDIARVSKDAQHLIAILDAENKAA